MSGRVPVRDDLVEVVPYGAPQIDAPVRLNVNETAEPPPPEFFAKLAKRSADLQLHRYPDRPATALRAALGAIEGLPAAQVWAANGSNEVLLQLFQAYGGPGRRMLLFRPGYSAHPLIARVASTEVVEADLDDDFVLTPAAAAAAATEHQPDITVIVSPNNPTGIPVAMATIRALHDACDGLVILDEAYVEFGGASARPLLDELDRLVITRTFSKAYRLAGLRLGYLLGPEWVVDDVRRVRLPYHLDAMKQAAGMAALDLRSSFLEHVVRVATERDRVRDALQRMPGVTVWPSAANFLLLRTPAPEVFQRLLDRGVLIRDFSTQRRLEGCIRVTIGTAGENDAFLTALGAVLAEA